MFLATMVILCVSVVAIAGFDIWLFFHLRSKYRELRQEAATNAKHEYDLLSLNVNVRVLYVLAPLIISILGIVGYSLVDSMKERTVREFSEVVANQVDSLVSFQFVTDLWTGPDYGYKKHAFKDIVDVRGDRIPIRKSNKRLLFASSEVGTPVVDGQTADSFGIKLLLSPEGHDSTRIDLVIVDLKIPR